MEEDNEERTWQLIDHPLAELKLKRRDEDIYGAIEAYSTKIRKDLGIDNPSVSLLLVNAYLNYFEPAIKAGYQTYRQVWKIQGNKESAPFIRLLYKRVVVPSIDQHLEKAKRCCNPSFPLSKELESSLQGIDYIAERLKEDWLRKCNITAMELEYASRISGNTSVDHSQSQQINAPVSESQELPSNPGDRYIFRIDGKVAIVKYDGLEIQGLQATQGIKLLAFLIANQGREFKSPQTLDNAFEGVHPESIKLGRGEIPKAEDGFRFGEKTRHFEDRNQLEGLNVRLKEIESEINTTQGIGHAMEVEHLKEEKERILEQVGGITTRLHRKSDWDPESKRIVNKYRNSLNRALSDIEKQANGAPLTQHFKQTLFPLAFPLTYRPSPTIDWQIQPSPHL
jgi:hypothetical protein